VVVVVLGLLIGPQIENDDEHDDEGNGIWR
jgi:hypothetical protein